MLQTQQKKVRLAINLLTEDPDNPSGAHWCWTRVIPEMAARLEPAEEIRLLVSPKSRRLHEGYGPNVSYVTYPWSNERRSLRTLSEHVYSPIRLPLADIDVLSTPMAPIVNPTWAVVVHFKTMHAYTEPDSLALPARVYRRLNYPRSARVAHTIVVNSESVRSEIHRYLDVDDSKLKLIYEAVDHDVFKPGDREEARLQVASAHGVTKPFALFVSSLWRYKNCDGLLRAWAHARSRLGDRQLAIVGPQRDEAYTAELKALAKDLDIAADVVWVGNVPLEETTSFYRAADMLVYPSFNETFGLPLLEAMACGCPVVTSDVSSMPEIAGGAAILSDPSDPVSIADGIIEALGAGDRLRDAGLRRASQFTWGSTAASTLDVYREAADARRSGRAGLVRPKSRSGGRGDSG